MPNRIKKNIKPLSNNKYLGIRELSFFHSYIDELPDDLYKYTELEDLRCGENNISELPLLPAKIKILNCEFNRISHLNNLIQLQCLVELDCSINKIRELNNLPATLKILNCSANPITELNNLPLGLENLTCDGICETKKIVLWSNKNKNIR